MEYGRTSNLTALTRKRLSTEDGNYSRSLCYPLVIGTWNTIVSISMQCMVQGVPCLSYAVPQGSGSSSATIQLCV